MKVSDATYVSASTVRRGRCSLADLGFVGPDQDPDDPVVITGVKRERKLTAAHKQTNQIIAAARAPSSTASPP